SFDYPDGVRIRIAHNSAREDPDRNPRRRSVDELRDPLQLLGRKLRGPETDQVGLRAVGVRPFCGDQVLLSNRDRLEALQTRLAGFRCHALQMEHAARTGGGKRGSKPLEVSLGGAKTAEERQ